MVFAVTLQHMLKVDVPTLPLAKDAIALHLHDEIESFTARAEILAARLGIPISLLEEKVVIRNHID